MSWFKVMSCRWRGLLTIVALVFLGGCFGGGQVPEEHFYRLDPPPPQSQFDVPLLKGILQVTRPRADALISERHLLYRENGEVARIHSHAYHRWVDSPTLILQQEIARHLRSARFADQVVTPELRTKVDFVLSCRIAKLERVLDSSPRVIMELELGLTHMRDRQTLLLQTYVQEQQSNGEGVTASIGAYNQALSNILARFMVDASELAEAGTFRKSP